MEVSDVFRGFRNGTFALNGSKFIWDFLNKVVFKILRRRSVFPRPLGRGHVHACTITFLFRSRDRWVKKVVFFFLKRKKTCFEFTFLLLFVWLWICRNFHTGTRWGTIEELEERFERVDIFWTLVLSVMNSWCLYIVMRNIDHCMSVEFCR